MEPQAVDTIIRHLTATIAKQDAINADLRMCIQEQQEFNAQQMVINERLTEATDEALGDMTLEQLLEQITRMGNVQQSMYYI